MKTIFAMVAGLACLVGIQHFVGSAGAQNKAVEKEPPHKVALIDMLEVIKQYDKFKGLQEDLKERIKEKEAEGKLLTDKVKIVVEKLNGTTLTKSSPEYQALEKEYLKLQGDMQAMKQSAQLELMREEARNYHAVYLDVQAAVAKFAKHFGYTLVLRFNKEEPDINDPQKVIQGLGRQVIYHDEGDDITKGVLDYLNRNMKSTKPATAPGAVEQTGGTRPAEKTAAKPKAKP